MRVSRGALLEALARVEPGRSTRDFLAQSACYVFQAGSVVTFNDEVCCRTASGLDRDFAGAVAGAPLKLGLENLTDDDIDLEIGPKELVVRGARKRFGVRLETEILLPVNEVEPPAGWTALAEPDEFAAALRAVCATAGSEADGFGAQCAHFTPSHLEACDLRQALRHQIGLPIPEGERFLVKAKSLAPAAGLGPTKMGLTPRWLHLRNKLLVYSVRRHLDDFPDLEPIFAFRGAPATLPKGAAEAAKLGAVFTADGGDDDKVAVNVSAGRMRVRGAGAYGWAEADLELAYEGDALAFRIAPAMLEKLVTDHNQCEVGPGKLRVDGERWQYVSVLGKPDTGVELPPAEPGVDTEDLPADAEADAEYAGVED